MRAVIQRVGRASVSIGGDVVGRIDAGLLVYLGVGRGDADADADYIAQKVRHLRVFQDENGRMNRDVVEAGGAVLVISNFTLYGDARKGRRPDYTSAADPERAADLYDKACQSIRGLGVRVETGRFRETMHVEAVNDGPINVLLDSKRAF
jgi:D-tyrosyl-tRNA(Tyr) deacylase